MEWYETMFDILDENDDTLEYTTEELNRYFTSGHLNATINEEEGEDMIDDDYVSSVPGILDVSRT